MIEYKDLKVGRVVEALTPNGDWLPAKVLRRRRGSRCWWVLMPWPHCCGHRVLRTLKELRLKPEGTT